MSLERLVARIRLCGGMLLMLYVICHLSNLSLGLWSLQLMEQWRQVIMVPWQSWIGQFMLVYWKQAPLNGLRQVLVVSAAWIHGCVGLHTWLRLRPWWPKVAGFVYP